MRVPEPARWDEAQDVGRSFRRRPAGSKSVASAGEEGRPGLATMCCEWVEVAMWMGRGERQYITICEDSHKRECLEEIQPNWRSELESAARWDDPALVVGDVLLEAGFKVPEGLRREDSLEGGHVGCDEAG